MTGLSATPLWVRASRRLLRRLPAGRYRTMNALVNCMRRFGYGVEPFLADTPTASAGFQFICHLQDALAREVCYTGCYAPLETLLVKNLLQPGMVFVDVGANWGYFTLLGAARVGESGRVLSLEPHPRLFALLQANLDHNGWKNVTPLPLAAAAEKGTVALAGFDEHAGNWGLSAVVPGPAPAMDSFHVPAAPIDPLLNEHGMDRVDLIKIDIEGSEEAALQGMTRGLAQHRYRCLLVELHPTILSKRGRDLEEVLAPLARHGYRGWWLDHSPAATKKACYRSVRDLGSFLQPIDTLHFPDTWPHTLWLPGEVELRDLVETTHAANR